eukprot:8268263-Pyramimonas_sp.AAC.1
MGAALVLSSRQICHACGRGKKTEAKKNTAMKSKPENDQTTHGKKKDTAGKTKKTRPANNQKTGEEKKDQTADQADGKWQVCTAAQHVCSGRALCQRQSWHLRAWQDG